MTIVLLALSLGSVAAVTGASKPWAWSAASLGLLAPRLVWATWFENGIRAWNKGSRLLAAVLREYVLTVCYYLLIGPVSRAGATLDLAGGDRETSRWAPRAPLGCGPLEGAGDERWVQRMRGAHGRHTWTIGLLPAVFLLMLLRDEQQENAPPSATYTLY